MFSLGWFKTDIKNEDFNLIIGLLQNPPDLIVLGYILHPGNLQSPPHLLVH